MHSIPTYFLHFVQLLISIKSIIFDEGYISVLSVALIETLAKGTYKKEEFMIPNGQESIRARWHVGTDG